MDQESVTRNDALLNCLVSGLLRFVSFTASVIPLYWFYVCAVSSDDTEVRLKSASLSIHR